MNLNSGYQVTTEYSLEKCAKHWQQCFWSQEIHILFDFLNYVIVLQLLNNLLKQEGFLQGLKHNTFI